MDLRWWVLLHIAGVAGFLAAHGVSMFVLFRVRKLGLDRARMMEYLQFSGATTAPMYVSLGVLLLGGTLAGLKGHWFGYWWIWASLAVLLATSALMLAIASPYFKRLKAACDVRPSGVPRVSDEELKAILAGGKTTLITAVGAGGLAIILYLMIFKPGVG